MTTKPAPRPVPKTVSGYAKGVASRTTEKKAPPSLGGVRLGSAGMFNPQRDGNMTLEQVGKGQKAIEAMMSGPAAPPRPGLSPSTIGALETIKAQMDRLPTPPTAAPTPAAPAIPTAQAAVAPPAPAPPPAASAAEEKPVATVAPEPLSARETLERMDDLEMERLFRGIQNDVINNTRERDAVRKRVQPLDLLSGIANGEFSQVVPIVPGRLVVEFRSLSGYENQSMRLLLHRMIAEDRMRENIATEMFGMMQACASVVHIQGLQKEPNHMMGENFMEREFSEEVFRKKFVRFAHYPSSLIHSIGTHALWFEERVREAFSSESVKNS